MVVRYTLSKVRNCNEIGNQTHITKHTASKVLIDSINTYLSKLRSFFCYSFLIIVISNKHQMIQMNSNYFLFEPYQE